VEVTEPIYCPARTYPATPFEPAEYCTNEVNDYGDLCAVHDEEDRSDADYDAWKERERYGD